MVACRYEDDSFPDDKESKDTAPAAGTWVLDQGKEDSRKYRRTMYNFERWAKHRSTSRYADNMRSIPK